MTKQFVVILILMVTLVAPAGIGHLEAADSDAIFGPTNLNSKETNAGEVDVITETDDLTDLLTGFSQWLDKFLASDATRKMFAISIWNH